MLVIRPGRVEFGSSVWESVERVAIESSSVQMIEDYDEEGPNLVFADSTRRRTGVRVFQGIEGDDLGAPDPGSEAVMRIEVDRGNDADQKVITMKVVVTGVSYSFSGARATREIKLVAVSVHGDSDPVQVNGGG